MVMVLFPIKIFKFRLELKCSLQKDCILDKINPKLKKLMFVIIKSAGNPPKITKTSAFFTRKCIRMKLFKFTLKFSNNLEPNG